MVEKKRCAWNVGGRRCDREAKYALVLLDDARTLLPVCELHAFPFLLGEMEGEVKRLDYKEED